MDAMLRGWLQFFALRLIEVDAHRKSKRWTTAPTECRTQSDQVLFDQSCNFARQVETAAV
jgi:hypothetical protein